MNEINEVTLTLLIIVLAIIGLIYIVHDISCLPPTHREDPDDRTGSTPRLLGMLDPGLHSYADPDGPPVASKGCYRVLLITHCSDPMMWYAKLVGQEVPYLGEWKAEKCFKSKEPAGYINIVKFADARVILKEKK